MQKAIADDTAARQAKENHALKRRLHQPMTEIWTFKKARSPYSVAGRWEVEGVRRNPAGRFARELSGAEIAAISDGVTTAAKIKPPVNKKRS